MTLRNLLLQAHSKIQKDRIIQFVGEDSSLFDELVSYVVSNDTILSQRASWPFSYIAIEHPVWIKTHEPGLIKALNQSHVHDAIKRNILRVWREFLPDDEILGEVFDCCSTLLRNPHEPGAIRAFAMQVMGNIVVRYPELKHELMLTVEDALLHSTPAIASSARKVNKQLSKLK
jgi:hypothetical protein